MPRPLYDGGGAEVILDTCLGRGGEGSVFAIRADAGNVAKIYLNPNPAKSSKIEHMVSVYSPALAKIAAWPVKTLHSSRGGAVVGFAMPRIPQGAHEIHNLSSPATRFRKYPSANWAFLVRAARNCAIAFDTVHASGCVIGDVSATNEVVKSDATVFLIDCDSYQISCSGRHFFCEVGTPEYTPPELHGKDLSKVVRTTNHDNFGLSVLIFQLLLMWHPYMGVYEGTGEAPTLVEFIRNCHYAYSVHSSRYSLSPAPSVIPMCYLPTPIQTFFERAFGSSGMATNGRPTAREWMSALGDLESGLRPCKSHRAHMYYESGKGCPWCDVTKRRQIEYFIIIDNTVISHSIFDDRSPLIVDLLRQFGLFQLEEITIPAIDLGKYSPKPVSPEVIVSLKRWTALKRAIWISVVVVIIVSALLQSMAFTILCGIGIMLVWGYSRVHNLYEEEVIERKRLLDDRRRRADDVLSQLRNCCSRYRQDYSGADERIRKLACGHRNIKGNYEQEIQSLRQQAKDQQFRLYMQGVLLEDSSIPNMGAKRIGRLATYGIVSAWDITNQNLRWGPGQKQGGIPGFAEVLCTQLLAWREHVAKGFRFDPKRAEDPAKKNQVARKWQQIQTENEDNIRRMISDQQRQHRKVKDEVERLSLLVCSMRREAAMAEADYTLLQRMRHSDTVNDSP
ncbi:MAG TPA: hypothetical protein PL033_06925 [Candidatus Brocadiia bacterium]|nr:hypothetical protein [Candidatus Brocadiia bacterium]